MNFALEPLRSVLVGVNLVVLGYFVLNGVFQIALMAAATLELRLHSRLVAAEHIERLLGSRVAPSVSVIAPAYNEAATITASVRALLTLRYPALELVVVNDGSADDTLRALKDAFELRPVHPIFRRSVPTADVRGVYRSTAVQGLLVVDKANGGKADALNAGLNFATGELVCAIDADTLIEPDALLRVARPFLTRDDVVATGGTIRVVNGCEVRAGRVVSTRAPRQPLAGIQAVEYLRAFLFGRVGWNRLGGNLIVSGAFGLFRRDAMLDSGGYLEDTVGEDMELIVRLRRHAAERGGRGAVVFVPDPVAWTEVPETLRVLGRQRDRWQRGLADVMVRHRGLVGRPSYGRLGLVVTPYFAIVELCGPLLELVGLFSITTSVLLGVDPTLALAMLVVGFGWGVPLSLTAVLVDQLAFGRYTRWTDLALLMGWAVAENLGYRQLTTLWRLRGLLNYARGSREWGTMTRQGFGAGSG